MGWRQPRELRDASRMGVQSAVSAAATFVILQAFGLDERFVGIISAVLVVRPSIGSTLGAAKQRFAATIIGSLVGLLCLWVLPGGYGTVIALAVSMMAMNFIAGLWPEWQYGAVAAIAISLGSEQNSMDTAGARAISIGIGSLVGTLTALIVWPDPAKKRAERHLRRALEAVADRLEAILEATKGERSDTGDDARDGYHEAISHAREAADAVRIGSDDRLSKELRHTNRLYNSLLILKRLAGEGVQLDEEDEEFAKRVESTTELACRIVRDLSSDSDTSSDRLRELRDELRETRRCEVGDDEGERVIHRHALIFGLDELEDALAELLQAADESAKQDEGATQDEDDAEAKDAERGKTEENAETRS